MPVIGYFSNWPEVSDKSYFSVCFFDFDPCSNIPCLKIQDSQYIEEVYSEKNLIEKSVSKSI